tara:strand:- start:7770 stop:9155 length:1386 start_codon:yes stop_codon:yes gene_type:complete
MTAQTLPSSFRDPSGYLYRDNGQLYRRITNIGIASYQKLLSSGFYDALVKNQLLIQHIETSHTDQSIVIKPDEIPYISYPYEWCFSQLKDAALLTLKIQKMALAHNMSLKDASAFNVQFHHGKPIFIDTLSFEDFTPGPWVAYKQFCQHFLAPLSLIAYKDRRFNKTTANHIDGLPLDLTSKLLPWKSYINLGLLLHIHLHAKYQDKHSNDSECSTNNKPSISKEKMMAMIGQIESTIKKLEWGGADTEWRDYYSKTNYQPAAMKQKRELVEAYLKTIEPSPQKILDLGANNGEFSHLAAKSGCYVVSQDIDESAVEANYLHCKNSGINNVLPLIQDLTNPTPAIGWEHNERMSLLERCNADACLALALIHHLAISNNLPLTKIASFFSRATNYLIIEFVPKTDSQVRRLLKTREDIFSNYNQEQFEHSFREYFTICSKDTISNSDRIMYLMKRLAVEKAE